MAARNAKRLVVFDFDHTLYDGDSGTHWVKWLISRRLWRRILALLIAPVAAPMIAWLPTRRRGIGAFVWVGTLGVTDKKMLDGLMHAYVCENEAKIRDRLLPCALEVLHQHREAGDEVIVATGAPPALARAILAFVAHESVPVIGTELAPRWAGWVARRHCHHGMKMQMIRCAGYQSPVWRAYSDSTADLPLLQAASEPFVVNPKAASVEIFKRKLPVDTPILNWGCPQRAGQPSRQ